MPSAPSLLARHHSRRAVMWVVGIAVAVILVDQGTKMWALSALADGRRIELLGSALSLILLHNPGAAFSTATGHTWVLTLVAMVISLGVVAFSGRTRGIMSLIAGLILGGAVGNLIDRMIRPPSPMNGHVVDFIDYGGWFVGNVADIAIVVAAALIMLLSLRGGQEEKNA